MCLGIDFFYPTKKVFGKDYSICGDFEYQVLFPGKARLISYTGKEENVVVPLRIKGLEVFSLGEKSFAENNFIKSVTLPNLLNEIQYHAFLNCKSLKKIKLPNSLRHNKKNRALFKDISDGKFICDDGKAFNGKIIVTDDPYTLKEKDKSYLCRFFSIEGVIEQASALENNSQPFFTQEMTPYANFYLYELLKKQSPNPPSPTIIHKLAALPPCL